jgi:hypothetical protein
MNVRSYAVGMASQTQNVASTLVFIPLSSFLLIDPESPLSLSLRRHYRQPCASFSPLWLDSKIPLTCFVLTEFFPQLLASM